MPATTRGGTTGCSASPRTTACASTTSSRRRRSPRCRSRRRSTARSARGSCPPTMPRCSRASTWPASLRHHRTVSTRLHSTPGARHLMPNRRDVLKAGLFAGGGLLAAPFAASLLPHAARAADAGKKDKADKKKGGKKKSGPLEILILGGTGFIGPHLVRLAVSRGHKVTIFTRGRKNPDLPEGITRLTGDRNGQLQALEGKTWDAVVDDSATNPEFVRQSAALLKDAVGRYLFTSSTGVYYPYMTRGLDETTAPHLDLKDEKDGSEDYGVKKARCEQIVAETFGD